MAFTQTWDEAKPAANDLAAAGDDEIRALKAAIRERLAVEHVITTGNETDCGTHRIASGAYASRPAFGTAGKLYISTDSPKALNVDLGTEWLELALPDLSSAKYGPCIGGLGMSTPGDEEHDIAIAAGWATDETCTYLIELASALTKMLDQVFDEGTVAGMLDPDDAVIAADEHYNIFLIRRDTDEVGDIFASTSDTPTLPTGYTYKRRIGSVVTDHDANIRTFVQAENLFMFKTPILVYDSTIGITRVTQALVSSDGGMVVPEGRSVEALLSVWVKKSANAPCLYICHPSMEDLTPSVNPSEEDNPDDYTLPTIAPDSDLRDVAQIRTLTNDDGEIAMRADKANVSVRVSVLGYVDARS